MDILNQIEFTKHNLNQNWREEIARSSSTNQFCLKELVENVTERSANDK